MRLDLIKNTGVQFHSIRLFLGESNISSIRQHFYDQLVKSSPDGDEFKLIHVFDWKDEELFLDDETINPEAYNYSGELVPSRINKEYVTQIDEDEVYTVRGADVLPLFIGHWFPLPYFRKSRDPKTPYHPGPQYWSRAVLHEAENSEDGSTHVLTIAFDTTIDKDDFHSEYSMPRESDATDNGSEIFDCVVRNKDAKNFYTKGVLNEWLCNLYDAWGDTRNDNKVLWHLAAYHTFIELLNSSSGFPQVSLFSGENTIEVGLVLDIGNSRTCGLICEKSNPFNHNTFDFTKARKLKIRNLSKPHEICEEPFEMQVAFAEEKFGNGATDSMEELFQWPSMVRVGPEATQLTSIFESEDSQATMSSPKRYLWDKSPVSVPWIKVDRDGRLGYYSTVDVRRYALYGIAQYLTSEGKVIYPNQRKNLMGATESHYSKSSIMTMAIYEILLHAIAQINDFEFRRDMGNSTYRRVLKDVVLTCPTAMTTQEQHALRSAAKEAAFLLSETHKEKIEDLELKIVPELPSLDPNETEPQPWKYDEATCSQLSFIYAQIVHKFNGQKDLFFAVNGKQRTMANGDTKPILNIASIDIGGGTTDLMICSFSSDENSEAPFIKPYPLFGEGFNIAGDDIVKQIIEFVFMPQIQNYLKEKGCESTSRILNDLFGPNIGGQTAQERIFRRQFANQIAAPCAYVALDQIIQEPGIQKVITLSDVFSEFPRPESGMIDYINKYIATHSGITNFDLEIVGFKLDSVAINQGVREIIGPVMEQLCFLISAFDCDKILLSGRPSKIPVIKDLIISSLTISPDKVICLGDYRFGQWYPFADSDGFVKDPKSTVCVGALVAYMNSLSRLPGLLLNNDNLNRIDSTSKYIGVLDDTKENRDRIKNSDLIFTPDQNSAQFKFYGESVAIGMRQLANEDWISSPLYLFGYKNERAKNKIIKAHHKLPFTVSVERFNNSSEFISNESLEIIDADKNPLESNNFSFQLCTAKKDAEYWRDSGSFIIRIES